VDRLFLDANVLFSAAYRINAGVALLWSIENVQLITSGYALAEVRRNLSTRDQKKRLGLLIQSVQVVDAITMPQTDLTGIHLPEKDRPILAGAIAGNCTHLISGDFKHFGPYYGKYLAGILVLPPAQYLQNAARTF
jgi:uncharacterized protein